MSNTSIICPEGSKKGPRSAQEASKILPKPSPNAPKSTPNRSKRPLGAHLGPMLYKSSTWNAQITVKKRPRAPKRGPRPAQTLPKWSPRPSQDHFVEWFFGIYVPKPRLQRFRGRCFGLSGIVAGRHDRLYVLPDTVLMGPEHVLTKSTSSIEMRKNVEKSPPESSKILPKSSPNPSQIHRKSKKIEKQIAKKCYDDLRCAQNAKNVRKSAKNAPKRVPRGGESFLRRRTRTPAG